MARKLIVLMLVVLVPSLASAGLVTFDFSGGSSSTSGSAGNVRTFSAGGISVTASAWSFENSGSNTDQEYLGWYSHGLGVTSNSSDDHYVDNNGRDEYVKFVFSEDVTIDSVLLKLYKNDADVSYLFGDFTNNKSNWFEQEVNGVAGNQKTVNFPDNALADEFRLGAEFDESNDGFKITSLTVETVAKAPPVPAPGAFLLAGLGTLGVNWVRRRRVL